MLNPHVGLPPRQLIRFGLASFSVVENLLRIRRNDRIAVQCKEQHQRAVQEDAKAEGEIHAGEEQGTPSRATKLVFGT